jgi:sulfur-oxidizing protein SoxY
MERGHEEVERTVTPEWSGSRGSLTRRRVLGLLGAGGAASALGRPRGACAAAGEPAALGVRETVAEGLARVFGNRPRKDGTGIVKLDVPAIAENGAVVPVAIEVVPAQAVTHLYIVGDKNRIPIVTRAALSPDAGPASLALTIRLGETGDVRAIAELSDGTLLEVKRHVKVTIGGCGG